MVTDCVFHVALVEVLCHFGPAGQPRKRATLAGALSGRRGGSQAPQDPVGPRWFTLLPTEMFQETEKMSRRDKNNNKRLAKSFVGACFKAASASPTLCHKYLFQRRIYKWGGI